MKCFDHVRWQLAFSPCVIGVFIRHRNKYKDCAIKQPGLDFGLENWC